MNCQRSRRKEQEKGKWKETYSKNRVINTKTAERNQSEIN